MSRKILKSILNYLILLFIPAFICVFALKSDDAFAADWSFSPSATLSQTYDSNFRFTPTSIPGVSKGDFITSFSPVVSITGETEQTKFQFDTNTTAQAYFKNPDFDTINTNTTASLTEDWSQRFSTSANLGLIHDWTLEDQLQASGIVAQKVERYLYSGGLGGKYDLNESLSLTASGLFAKTIYPSGTLPDSDAYQGTITPIWALTERDNIGLSNSLSYTDYNNATTVKTITEMFYWQRILSETLNVKLSGGYYFTTVDYVIPTLEFIPIPPFIRIVNRPFTTNDTAPVFGVDLNKDWSERFSTTLSAGSQQYSDVNARSFDSTFISCTGQYKLSERTTVNLVVRYNMNNQISQGSEKIDYYIINPSIERSLTENFSVRLSGSYENESDKNYGGVAGTNLNYDRFRTWVDLIYKWPRFFASH